MKYLYLISIFFVFFSCKEENFKKIDAEEIVEEELQSLNLKEIDRYPLFLSCDETFNRKEQEICFEKNLHQWIISSIDTLTTLNKQNDTLSLCLSVDKNGNLLLDSVAFNPKWTNSLKKLLKNSPKLHPAQKSGTPVRVSLQLPLILEIN